MITMIIINGAYHAASTKDLRLLNKTGLAGLAYLNLRLLEAHVKQFGFKLTVKV